VSFVFNDELAFFNIKWSAVL